MPGAGWSALGAAILGGNNAFQGAIQNNNRDALAKAQLEEMASRLQSEALQRQVVQENLKQAPLHLAGLQTQNDLAQANLGLTQNRLANIPRDNAQEDVKNFTSQLGDDRFNNPSFLETAKTAGLTIPTQDVQRARIQGIESGAGAPVPSTAEQALKMGVAPDTGAQLPPEVLLRQKDNARKGTLDDLTVEAMKSAFGKGGQAGGGFELGPNGAPLDSPKNRQMGALLGANDPITKMYGAPRAPRQTPEELGRLFGWTNGDHK